jgi:hypothetical protein
MLYGSLAVGLGTESSDIDLAISFPDYFEYFPRHDCSDCDCMKEGKKRLEIRFPDFDRIFPDHPNSKTSKAKVAKNFDIDTAPAIVNKIAPVPNICKMSFSAPTSSMRRVFFHDFMLLLDENRKYGLIFRKIVLLLDHRVSVLHMQYASFAGSAPRDVDFSFFRDDLPKKVSLMRSFMKFDTRVAPLLYFVKLWSLRRKIGFR